MSDSPTLCTAVVVRCPTDPRRILMLRRHRVDGQYDPYDGHWSLPGGKVQWGEEPSRCAVRELAEETGLRMNGLVRLIGVTSQVAGNSHSVGLIYEAQALGEPENRKPDRHDAIEWVDIDLPPAPLMLGASAVMRRLREEAVLCPATSS